MRNGKIRRFRPRSKHHSRRSNVGIQNNGIKHINGHSNHFQRGNISKNPHNLEKIIEKYKNLAKESLSSGDKILYENYLQHSDHFSRILSELNNFRSKGETTEKSEKQEVSNSDTK
tara:strand:- start:464 stop:811 length:348 start_codon:yes stop_codon:yes gene_type:complete